MDNLILLDDGVRHFDLKEEGSELGVESIESDDDDIFILRSAFMLKQSPLGPSA